MRLRAHRSAYVLLVKPLGDAWRREQTNASWDAFRSAAFTWLEDVSFERRGAGAINRDLRERFGLRWNTLDWLKAVYSRRMAAILYEKYESPFLSLVPRARVPLVAPLCGWIKDDGE